MARPLRIEYPGAVYHVTSRGNARMDIFLSSDIDADDRQLSHQRVVEVHITYGYTLKEIADCIGIHYTTVSKIVSKAREK